MNVLALAFYPVEAAATRYRPYQFVEPLAERGIKLTVRPFLDSRSFAALYDRKNLVCTGLGFSHAALASFGDFFRIASADVLLVQREDWSPAV